MAKPSSKRVKRKEAQSVETEPDAWERFARAIRKIAPPKVPEPARIKGHKPAIDLPAPEGSAEIGYSDSSDPPSADLKRIMEGNSKALSELTSGVHDSDLQSQS